MNVGEMGESEQWRLLLFERINTPGIEPIKHEQEVHNDKPQIGEATLFLTLQSFDKFFWCALAGQWLASI
jgi:hypothetical protein